MNDVVSSTANKLRHETDIKLTELTENLEKFALDNVDRKAEILTSDYNKLACTKEYECKNRLNIKEKVKWNLGSDELATRRGMYRKFTDFF